jgi:hypothetical protein
MTSTWLFMRSETSTGIENSTALGLGELLFGPGRVAHPLMLKHKQAVGSVLLAMAGRWEYPASPFKFVFQGNLFRYLLVYTALAG